MPKSGIKTVYVCSACGNEFPKWLGQCSGCHEWGTIAEFHVSKSAMKRKGSQPREAITLSEILHHQPMVRISTKIKEVDRVLGGGLLEGSLVLLGGNPGVGKSTLALQIIAGGKVPALYVSAEESEDQIAMRARRLKILSTDLQLSGENQVEKILDQITMLKPVLVIIDSIQTVFSDALDSLPGSISQIRECGQQLLQVCKQKGVTVIIVGHVTKGGIIAGPKMLEHMVDTVLYLDGDERYDHRILRAVKNRFGATNEVGIFQMDTRGLVQVSNPSELFLAERMVNVAGTAIYPSIEGTRPILVEVQALVSNASFGTPQRNVNGFDLRRLSMLLAVLEKRISMAISTRDVFVNLVGGLRVDDPAADLAIISTVASSALDKPIPPKYVLVGEVGLSGEVRSVSRLAKRIQEAQALGFSQVIAPKASVQRFKSASRGINIKSVSSVRETFDMLF